MDNYTTPEEIDEMRELQQVATTGHRSAKRCRFYRVELLNVGNIGCGEKCRQIDGNGAKVTCVAVVAKWDLSVGYREREEKKGKHIKC